MIRGHFQQAKRAFIHLFSKPIGTLLTLIMLMVTMAFPLVLYLSTQSLEDWHQRMLSAPQLNIFVEPNADGADLSAIQSAIKNNPNIRRYEFISKTKAWEDLKNRNIINDTDTLAFNTNLLPDVFTLSPNVINPEELTRLKQQFEAIPMVSEVDIDLVWANKLYQMVLFANKLLWLLGIVFATALFLIVSNTIRMQILARHNEIEISKLIGASDRFIRRPFIYYALWQALLASVLSIALSYWVVEETNPIIRSFSKLYDEHIFLRHFTPQEITIIIAMAVLTSIVAAIVASTHHLRNIEPS
jgi:cell division transport system permease protein